MKLPTTKFFQTYLGTGQRQIRNAGKFISSLSEYKNAFIIFLQKIIIFLNLKLNSFIF